MDDSRASSMIGVKLIYFKQRKDVFRVIPLILGKISKTGKYLGREFLPYLDGKINFTSACACIVHEYYRPNKVKIPIPNILRFANFIPNTPGMTRKKSFPCIKYRMQRT